MGMIVPDIMSRMISSASALAHANLSGPRLADAYVSGLPFTSRLRVSIGDFGISLESGPANRTLVLNARWARDQRRSSRVLFAGRRRRAVGMLRGGSTMTRNGLCSSMGCRSSGGRLSRMIVGTGRSGLAGGLSGDLSRRIHVRTSLTFATKASLVLDDET